MKVPRLKDKYIDIKDIYYRNNVQQTTFESGELILTSHRLIWIKPSNGGNNCLSLSHQYIVYMEKEASGPLSFTRSKKVVLYLSEPVAGKI